MPCGNGAFRSASSSSNRSAGLDNGRSLSTLANWKKKPDVGASAGRSADLHGVVRVLGPPEIFHQEGVSTNTAATPVCQDEVPATCWPMASDWAKPFKWAGWPS